MMPRSVSIAYIDVLTCLFTIFVALFILSAEEDKAKGNIIDPSQFLVEVTWGDTSVNDVDLWMSNPSGAIAMYTTREIGGMTIDTDNTGINAYMKDLMGEKIAINGRREVGNIRSVMAGRYVINLFLYSKRTAGEEKVKVSIKKLNPYQILSEKEIILTESNEEVTVLSFEVDENGKVLSKDEDTQESLYKRLTQ